MRTAADLVLTTTELLRPILENLSDDYNQTHLNVLVSKTWSIEALSIPQLFCATAKAVGSYALCDPG